MIIIDTSVLSTVLRRKPSSHSDPSKDFLVQAIEEDWPIGIPGIVYQEILTGVRTKKDRDHLSKALEGFDICLANKSTHEIAADIRTKALQKGISCAGIDCLIAATSIEIDGQLLTLDQDFKHLQKVSQLQIISL